MLEKILVMAYLKFTGQMKACYMLSVTTTFAHTLPGLRLGRYRIDEAFVWIVGGALLGVYS